MSNHFGQTTQLIPQTQNDVVVIQPPVQFLLVALATYRYGVRLDTLQEVLRYDQLSVAPVPGSPEWLDGITSLRGNILSAVDLRAFLGLPRRNEKKPVNTQSLGIGRSSPRLLVVHTEDITVGVVVDDIEGVIFVQPEQIRGLKNPVADKSSLVADPALAYLAGVYSDLENKIEVALLDLSRLVTSSQMLNFEPAHQS